MKNKNWDMAGEFGKPYLTLINKMVAVSEPKMETLIASLCDGDRRNKHADKVTVKALDTWYKKMGKKGKHAKN